MLKWIVILLIVAAVAGVLGFTGVANVAGKGAMFLAALLIAGIAIVLLLFAWAGGGLV
ncbi:MAG TPA: DUF1328 domain-containing protein [Rhizobiaceae bacterium]|nr:DUF1328 domain-containing protein [Rhizobiaceae bacterium]